VAKKAEGTVVAAQPHIAKARTAKASKPPARTKRPAAAKDAIAGNVGVQDTYGAGTQKAGVQESHDTGAWKAGVQKAYDGICESWDESRRRPFPPMPLFLEEFQRRFSKRAGTLTHAKILDAGCGNARNSIWLSKKLPRAFICCCDSSAGMLHSASRNVAAACRAHSCRISRTDIEDIRHPSGLFDAVLCTAVLHHIPTNDGRVRALSEIRRVLKPNGFAFVTVWSDPDETPGTDREVEFPTGRGGKIKRYYHFFSRSELKYAARKAGFEVADAFYEAGGRRTDEQDCSKARNLCVILQKPRKHADNYWGKGR